MHKNTHQYLVYELLKLNSHGLYDKLIQKCRDGLYHNFMSPVAFPKNQLVIDMGGYAELKELCNAVIEGEYDEAPPTTEVSNSAWALRMLQEGADEKIINKFLQ